MVLGNGQEPKLAVNVGTIPVNVGTIPVNVGTILGFERNRGERDRASRGRAEAAGGEPRSVDDNEEKGPAPPASSSSPLGLENLAFGQQPRLYGRRLDPGMWEIGVARYCQVQHRQRSADVIRAVVKAFFVSTS